MKTINLIVRELIGLSVDDGSLAVAVLALLAVIAWLTHAAIVDSNYAMCLFVAGTIVALIENVVRAAR
jgi:hypothetical protein